jgi:glycosyltransferase involved in cell wall biosynthesis
VTVLVHIATRYLASGAERTVADIVAALPEVRHVLIVGRDHRPESIRTLCGDIEWHVAPSLVRRPGPMRDLLAYRELRRLLREIRPDAVHTIQSKSGILGRLAARGPGARSPRPTTVHSVVMANFGPGFGVAPSLVYRNAERAVARWTDQYLVNGLELRDRFARAGIADVDRFELVRSSVDTSAFQAAAGVGRPAALAALSLPAGDPLVLFAGSLDTRKGAQELPRYLAALRAERPDARLLVAGEGPLRERIEHEMAALGLTGAVDFLGFTPRLPELLAASDALVMLSRAEGIATVLLHAAAAGRPFVSTAVDGPGELIHLGAVGRVVPVGDLVGAARATVDVIDGPAPRPLELAEWVPATVRHRYREVLGPLLGIDPGMGR